MKNEEISEEDLMEFIQWLPKNIVNYAENIPEEILEPIAQATSDEEVYGILQQLSKDKNGQALLTSLMGVFKEEREDKARKNRLFKKGGKMDYLVKKFNVVL